MKQISSNLIIYENILKIPFLNKCYFWYKEIGYNFLKEKYKINFPALRWYNYFSHPIDSWLLIGGYFEKIEKEKTFQWIFYIQNDVNTNNSKLVCVQQNFSFYFTKNKNNIILNFIPNNLYMFQNAKIKKSMFPKNI